MADKFKAGDRITCVWPDDKYLKLGQEYTVIGYSTWDSDTIVIEGFARAFNQNRFEKAENGS